MVKLADVTDLRMFDPMIHRVLIDELARDSGRARAEHIDRVDVAGVQRFLGRHFKRVERELENFRIRFLDADHLRVDDDVEEISRGPSRFASPATRPSAFETMPSLKPADLSRSSASWVPSRTMRHMHGLGMHRAEPRRDIGELLFAEFPPHPSRRERNPRMRHSGRGFSPTSNDDRARRGPRIPHAPASAPRVCGPGGKIRPRAASKSRKASVPPKSNSSALTLAFGSACAMPLLDGASDSAGVLIFNVSRDLTTEPRDAWLRRRGIKRYDFSGFFFRNQEIMFSGIIEDLGKVADITAERRGRER